MDICIVNIIDGSRAPVTPQKESGISIKKIDLETTLGIIHETFKQLSQSPQNPVKKPIPHGMPYGVSAAYVFNSYYG